MLDDVVSRFRNENRERRTMDLANNRNLQSRAARFLPSRRLCHSNSAKGVRHVLYSAILREEWATLVMHISCTTGALPAHSCIRRRCVCRQYLGCKFVFTFTDCLFSSICWHICSRQDIQMIARPTEAGEQGVEHGARDMEDRKKSGRLGCVEVKE